MAMPISAPRYTVDDLDRFPADGNRYEILGGMLLVTPAPAAPHQIVTLRLASALLQYLKPFSNVYAASPGEVILAPMNRLEPDILVFQTLSPAESWEAFERWLAVEVASPSTRIYDRDFKRPAYLALGVREFWRVEPRERTITSSRQGSVESVWRDRVTWQPEAGRAPLVIDLGEIFQGLP
ncbi:MAG: Uma2 family endonuclease [Gemmatimonadota bacterium]